MIFINVLGALVYTSSKMSSELKVYLHQHGAVHTMSPSLFTQSTTFTDRPTTPCEVKLGNQKIPTHFGPLWMYKLTTPMTSINFYKGNTWHKFLGYWRNAENRKFYLGIMIIISSQRKVYIVSIGVYFGRNSLHIRVTLFTATRNH